MSKPERRPFARALVPATAVLVAMASVLTLSGAAFASEFATGPEPVRRTALAAGYDPDAANDVGVAVLRRATASAVELAWASSPTPPPRVFCPVPGSEFVDSWGFARSGGRAHKGVDMMAPYGAPVLAPVAGTVRSSNSSLGGLGFYLDDEDGNEMFGSHLATLDVTGWVEAGTQIGTVGTSGNAGTPHLHFEIAPRGGASVNPFPYALSWCMQDPQDPWAEVARP